MKDKTIQQEVFREIRRRDGITYADLSEMVGVSEDAIFARMKSDVGLSKFVEMLQACGYDITISKTRPGQEPGIHYGEAACDSCKWKIFSEDVIAKAESLKEAIAEEQKTITE